MTRSTGPRRGVSTAYGRAGLVVAVATAAGALLAPYLDLASLVMVYLVTVVFAATRLGRGPSLFASLLSVAAFDFLFVPPRFTFAVADTQYLVTFAVMSVVTLVISDLAARIRAQADEASARERATAALYAMSRDLARASTAADIVTFAARHVGEVFASEVTILLADAAGILRTPGSGPLFEPDASDRAVAHEVFARRESAAVGATSRRAVYLPLVGSRGSLGVLGVRPAHPRAFDARQRLHDLEAFGNQTALALERARLADEARQAELHAERERLRNALLSSVSHDLRTPLTTITGAATTLLADATVDDRVRRELLESVREEAERLNRLVQNLLEMTRLESGTLTLHREWHAMEEVVGAALRRCAGTLAGRRCDVRVPPDLPLVEMDDVLIEQVIVNLLDNAAKYSAPGAPLRIAVSGAADRVTVEVADRGPGVPPDAEERIFEKFYRSASAPTRGAGLGLAIAKGVVEAHCGRIWTHNLPEGGAAFFLVLPVTGTPPCVRHE